MRLRKIVMFAMIGATLSFDAMAQSYSGKTVRVVVPFPAGGAAELPCIKCPTLVITTEESGLGTVECTRQWQERIPDSRLLVLPGKSYHVAASDAVVCAEATLAFLRGTVSSG